MDQVITSLGSVLIKTVGQVIKSKIEADTKTNNPAKNHPIQVKHDPKKPQQKKHEQPKKVEHPQQAKTKIMDERWVSIAKLEQPLKIFKQAIHDSETSKIIKKQLNCDSFRLRRIYLKKNFKGYLYWLHVDVIEIGNQGQYTIILRQLDGQLEVLDIENSLLSVTKSIVPLPKLNPTHPVKH